MKATRRIRLGRWLAVAAILGVLALGPVAVFGDGSPSDPDPGPITTPDGSSFFTSFEAAAYGSFLVLDAMY
jgi:hypothetical protein